MKIAVSVSKKEMEKREKSPYFKALLAAGARPDEIDLVDSSDRSRALVSEYDGVLFCGGEDVDPALYGEVKKYPTVKVDAERDKFELALLDRTLGGKLPILGICRGIQLINVKFGGTLHQDLKEEGLGQIEHKQGGSRVETTHNVALTEPESLLAQTFQGSCRVNSLHHQAIKSVGRGLKMTASSEDGVVEAVEAADEYPFLVAVQWHPEEMVAEHAEQKKIFEQFLARCRETAERRKHGKPTS